jgi:hypothetical protein
VFLCDASVVAEGGENRTMSTRALELFGSSDRMLDIGHIVDASRNFNYSNEFPEILATARRNRRNRRKTIPAVSTARASAGWVAKVTRCGIAYRRECPDCFS